MSNRSLAGALLALVALLSPASSLPGLAQSANQGSGQAAVAVSNPLTPAAVQSLLARGDAAAAAGNLSEARGFYDQARDLAGRLLSFYRDLSGAFRGLDARIPREMDQRGRETLALRAQANLRLAALFRRQNQPEVAVPLLVEVVQVMTPTSEEGRQAYQALVEIGFATTPYTAGQVSR